MNAPRWFWYVVAAGVAAVGAAQLLRAVHEARREEWSVQGNWAVVEAKTGTVCQRLVFEQVSAFLECVRYDRGVATTKRITMTFPGDPFAETVRFGAPNRYDAPMDTGMRMDTLESP